MKHSRSNTAVGIVCSVALLAALAVALPACTGDEDAAKDERVVELETKVQSLEETVDALAGENAGLKDEVALLRQERADLAEALEAAEAARLQQQAQLDARLRELEAVTAKVETLLSVLEQRTKGNGESKSSAADTVVEQTARLAEEFGGEVYYIDHPERGDRTVLVMPLEIVDGETPLIVSLHGFGGDSLAQSTYLPLHERVNAEGFALLLPNGATNAVGNRFWNPTDECCEDGKSGEDDVAYLTELVAAALKVKEFGPVYFFGYSNGGFMAYHMACKGLPGLRAVASLAGTSYVEDASCGGAAPVSVLHIHGTADTVIRFDGDESARVVTDDGEAAFYLGARDMAARWSRIAGCEWPVDAQPSAALDLDRSVPGAETQAYRVDSGCADGITVELWAGEGGGHFPRYDGAFVDALLEWLLGQG